MCAPGPAGVPLAAEKMTSPVHGGPVDIFRGGQFTKYPVRYLVGDRVRNILTKYFVDPFVVYSAVFASRALCKAV